jgi:hypothetical protein
MHLFELNISSHHSLVGGTALEQQTNQKAFIINDFLRNPDFRSKPILRALLKSIHFQSMAFEQSLIEIF